MKTKILSLKDQAKGQFNFGEILENKPIGFPQDGGKLKPYSSLFYWAHAWTPDKESLIGEHPHQGFEIMSFVLKGSIEHFDNKNNNWRTLNDGDAQIIRSGSGITHAEKVNEKSEFFQIWIDPDLEKTMKKEASYDDYPSEAFPVEDINGIRTKFYRGNDAPMTMDTPGITIREMWIQPGKHEIKINKMEVNSIYLIKGDIELNEQEMKEKDYAIVSDGEALFLNSRNESRLFMIQSPEKLEYITYSEKMRRHFV